jgi:hypothetical protein
VSSRLAALVTRRLALLATAAVTALATVVAAPAAPQRDTVVRLGKGIGKIDRGMTLPQVRRALGGPHLTMYRRLDFGVRGRYVELGWERAGRRAWEPVIWMVGFRSTSRTAPLRVVRVATTNPKERTPRRIGVGSTVRQIVSAYPRATCVERGLAGFPAGLPHAGIWIVVAGPRGGMTTFQMGERGPARMRETPLFAAQVMVQGEWFSKGTRHEACRPGWERW